MLEINVTIHCPELAQLAEALAGRSCKCSDTHVPADPVAPVVASAAPVVTYPAPVATPAPVASPAPVAPPAPVAAPTAPTSPAPQITLDQIGKAGADLIRDNPAAMPQLMGLLAKYGVQSAQQLKPDQIGPFATEMRGLGAKI